jgi:hypothetical protein
MPLCLNPFRLDKQIFWDIPADHFANCQHRAVLNIFRGSERTTNSPLRAIRASPADPFDRRHNKQFYLFGEQQSEQ